jgi:SOS-response transcriptional repressor LexA
MSRPRKPNPRRDELFTFIRSYMNHSGGIPPTIREIGDEFRTSTSVVNYYLDDLVEAGKIGKTPKIARGIYLIDPSREEITVYRCPNFPKCDIHAIYPGECTDCHIPLIPIIYLERL